MLGIFAWEDTFNDETEEVLAEKGLEPYDAAAPTLAEMTEVALRFAGRTAVFCSWSRRRAQTISATATMPRARWRRLRRADEGLGVALDYVEKHPNTLLLTCADSEAGAPDLVGLRGANYEKPLLEEGKDSNGAPVDGAERRPEGGVAQPFVSGPDRAGKTHEFVVVWATRMDASGGIVAAGGGTQCGPKCGEPSTTRRFIHFSTRRFSEAAAGERMRFQRGGA